MLRDQEPNSRPCSDNPDTQEQLSADLDVLVEAYPHSPQVAPLENGNGGTSMPRWYQKGAEAISRHPERASGQVYEDFLRVMGIKEGSTEKQTGQKTLANLDLPRYQKQYTSVKKFLRNTNVYFSKLETETYFPTVVNPQTGERLFALNLNRRETIKYIRNLLLAKRIDENYELILSEYHANFFSGNIIINPPYEENNENSEYIKIEIVHGEHKHLAYGSARPLMIVNSKLNGVLDYRVLAGFFSDKLQQQLGIEANNVNLGYISLREVNLKCQALQEAKNLAKKDKRVWQALQGLAVAVYSSLKLIPKDQIVETHAGSIDDKRIYHPGYYEFVLDNCLQAWFLDHREPDHYSITRGID